MLGTVNLPKQNVDQNTGQLNFVLFYEPWVSVTAEYYGKRNNPVGIQPLYEDTNQDIGQVNFLMKAYIKRFGRFLCYKLASRTNVFVFQCIKAATLL